MADPRPAERVYVTVNDVRYELVPVDKLTFPELKEVKQVSDGMTLVELEQGLAKVDGDAWFAWIYISQRRSKVPMSADELAQAIGDTPIIAVIETVEREAPEVAAPDPPVSASGSDAPAQQNGNDSSATTLRLSTPEPAGHLT